MKTLSEVRRDMTRMESTLSRRPCAQCGEPTLIATLSEYGTSCYSCHTAYCQERPTQPTRSKAAEKVRAEITAAGRRLPK